MSMWPCLSPVKQPYLFVMLHWNRVKEGHQFCINTDLNIWTLKNMYTVSLYSPLCFSISRGQLYSLNEVNSQGKFLCIYWIWQLREQQRLAVRPEETCNYWWFGEHKFDHYVSMLSPIFYYPVAHPSALSFELDNDLIEAYTLLYLRIIVAFPLQMNRFLSMEILFFSKR